MSEPNGILRIGDDEILFRRIPVSTDWYDGKVSPNAFNPTKSDIDGISVYRKTFLSAPDLAGKGRNVKGYYVVALRAIDLKQSVIRVIPNPLPDDPDHALIPDLTYSNKDSDRSKMLKIRLAELCILPAEGPFIPTNSADPT